MSFDAKPLQIKSLFTKHIFTIPRNQRRYVWNKENWSELYEDLKFIIENKKGNAISGHFLGSFVLQKKKEDNDVTYFEIIDGQQRSITIVLFLAAIMQYFKEHDMKDFFDGCRDFLKVKDAVSKEHCVIETDYYDAIEKIVDNVCDWENRISDINKFIKTISVGNINSKFADCFLYFYKLLQSQSKDFVWDVRRTLADAKYIHIQADNNEDSYTIFEILNARGMALEDFELIKNFIMRYILPQEETMVDRVKELWKEKIENPLSTNISKFFQHYAKHKYRMEINQKDVFNLIKKTARKNVNDFFEDLLLKAGYYKLIISPVDTEISDNLSETENFVFSFLRKKRAIQFRPILMSLMHMKAIGDLTEEAYNEVLLFIYRFFVCYNIIGEEKSNKLEDVIRKYAPLIENEFSEQVIDEFEESLKKRIPDFNTFQNAFRNIGWSNHNTFYKDSKLKNRVVIVLELIESYESRCPDVHSFTIEHIIPDSSNNPEAYNIGNLIPLEEWINKGLKDKSIDEKVQAYRDSGFKMARNIAGYYSSNFDPIKRNKLMAKKIYHDILKLDLPDE